jgi:tricorn protease
MASCRSGFRFGLRSALQRAVTFACLLLVITTGAFAADVNDTRLLTQPAVSARRIAFVYAGDLWTCDRSGGNVRRVTADAGQVSNPVFSPDGSLIAFSAQYDGNTDVFVVPAEGGVPTRLTFHPGADTVQAFTPDGKAVLFTSARAAFNNRYQQLFTVSVTGGVETPLPIPNASRATYAADDQHIAYTPLAPMFLEWKHYRGGTASRILLYRASDHGVDPIPQPSTRANDVDPMWVGDIVYFRSDRDGEFNLYAFDTKSKSITPLTHYTDFPVLNAAASVSSPAIVYEQAGYLHLLDLSTKQDTRLKIGVAADLVETRPRFVKGAQYIRHAAISPSGARAVFEFRGEIVTVPAEKGDARNLTSSVAVHDRSPAWSPDGKFIAYFSDDGGEYSLIIANQDGKNEPAPRKIKLSGAGFYDQPVWSPDSAKIAYQDNSESLFIVDVKSGVSKKITQEPHYSPGNTMTSSWSPDSKWVAYTVDTPAMIQTVHVYSVEQDKSFAVTDGLSEVSEPVFDRSGKYLFFLGSTDAGPVKDWFAQSNSDARSTEGIYVAVLRNDLPSPIAKESDEEKGSSADEKKKAEEEKEKKKPLTAAAKGSAQDRKDTSAQADEKDKDKDAKDAGDAKDEKPTKPVVVRIDFDGLASRIQDLPIPVGQYSQLEAGTEGQLYFLKTVDTKSSLQRFDLKTRKTEQVLPEAAEFFVSANGKKMLYRTKETWSIVALTPGKKIEPSEGKLAIDSVEVRVDPHAEWPQIFNEAWRINRDYFYAPNMHGVNWTAARDKYAALLPDVTNRADLSRVIQWMCSELSVGHHRGGGGDTRLTATTVPGGLLGADYRVENGRYRLAKIYGGLNWNPELRAPLTQPGVNAKVGEYLLAVNGRDLRAPTTNLYSLFENTSGKITEITIGPNPDGSGSRTVQVVPIANEAALRNRDWVEGNLRKVEAATGGRVAYVYVPNTAGLGYAYFKRYFYPQANRDAIIVDERFNSGGQVADYYIDILRRPLISYWATRYGDDIKTPAAGIHGPKVMITDETAGSGGDLLPFMFRQAKLGPIVGKRTWGGLVGVLGFPTLMDGGSITAPNLAIWTEDGWVVENEGVPPDIEVEQTPADVIAGHDPQLERAIAVVMDALKKDPPKHPTRPPYPVKVAPTPTSTGQP